jgi:hypothetical protein
MISQNDFQNALGKIGPKFKNPNINWHSWYMQYSYYESMWNNYFENFIETYSKLAKPTDIQFVFWESCPGGMPFPHQNYAFDSNRFNNLIHGTFDTYLKNECTASNIDWELNGTKRKIGDIIIDLAKNGVLIIDLYPTHGISLDATNRENLFKYLFDSYSIDKLTKVGYKIKSSSKNNSKIKVTSELWNAGINDKMEIDLKIKVQKALGINCLPDFHM